MDCRILNVRTYVIILMRAYVYVHTHESWAHRQLVSTWLGKKRSQFFLVLRTGFEPQVFGSGVDAPPRHPPEHAGTWRSLDGVLPFAEVCDWCTAFYGVYPVPPFFIAVPARHEVSRDGVFMMINFMSIVKIRATSRQNCECQKIYLM